MDTTEKMLTVAPAKELSVPPAQDVGIVIDDGTRKVPITNLYGQRLGVFYIRPTDVNIIHRYNHFVDNFDTITEPLKDAGVNPDGTAIDKESEKALDEATKRLFEQTDALFDGNFSEAFFGRMNPFSLVNGGFYCETAMEVVGKYISKEFDTEVKHFQNRVDKYTHGYRTGKHQNGGQRKRG